MSAVFLKLLNMSITASYFALGVMILRLVLKKAPKWIAVLLWGLVGLRLLIPFSIESKQSLIPNTEPIPSELLTATPSLEQMQSTIYASDYASIEAEYPGLLDTTVATPTPPVRDFATIAANIWILGMILMLGYFCFSYLRLHRKLREAVPLEGKLWLCDHIPSPFLLGFFRPRIYLPSDLAEEDLSFVIAHEEAHLKRKDHWWKPLAFLLLTVYWFNPVLWIAYLLLCRDIEFACDEKVMEILGNDSKKLYSQALLRCSSTKLPLSACPLAFGEGSVKKRISAILSYKKPAFWIVAASLVLSIMISLSFLTDPSTKSTDTTDYSKAMLWFDELEYEDDCAIDAEHFRLPIFPDMEFRRTGDAIEIHNGEDSSDQTSFGTCLNAFFTDLTQDGIPELCMTLQRASHSNLDVVVYDITSGFIYSSDQWMPGNYSFKQEGDALRIIRFDPEGSPQYDPNTLVCFPIMPNLRETVVKVRAYIAEAEILHIGEPLLVPNARSIPYLFGYSANSLRYPFYLSTGKPLLSLFEKEELLDFLREEIPDCDPISEPMYNTAIAAIKIVELDPSYNANYTAIDKEWYVKVTKAAKAYYVGTESVRSLMGTKRLTMDDVSELSKLGHDLSWDHLRDYEAIDIGSGLYVLVFPINDTYELICSGGSLVGKPAGVTLKNRLSELSYDIREGQLYQFLLTPFIQKWFDTEADPSVPVEDLQLPQFPDTVFSYDDREKRLLKTVKGQHNLISHGVDVINAYFYDLNNDHIPELCFTCTSDSSESATQVQIIGINDSSTHTFDPSPGGSYSLSILGGNLFLTHTDSSSGSMEHKSLHIIMNQVKQNQARLAELWLEAPQYFHLDASEGFTVEIRQISDSEIVCELYEGKDAVVPSSDQAPAPCAIADMKLIIDGYKLDPSNITIHATPTTYSQLHYDSEAEYQEAMTTMFFVSILDS